jgi:hypothetical protein
LCVYNIIFSPLFCFQVLGLSSRFLSLYDVASDDFEKMEAVRRREEMYHKQQQLEKAATSVEEETDEEKEKEEETEEEKEEETEDETCDEYLYTEDDEPPTEDDEPEEEKEEQTVALRALQVDIPRKDVIRANRAIALEAELAVFQSKWSTWSKSVMTRLRDERGKLINDLLSE